MKGWRGLRGQAVLAGILAAAGLPSEAKACGGLFCSQSAPVNQTAERIIFSKNEDETVTTIVEILYQGEAENFAWVLPVPGAPEVGVSSTQVLDRLQGQTNPQFLLNRVFEDCGQQASGGFAAAPPSGISPGTVGSAGTGGSSAGPSVVVVDAGLVGAFEYETISVDAADEDPSDVAIRWLDDNGYDTGSLGADVLRPYLQNGLNLIAFRLQKGASSGSIRPISLTYEANRPSIPIVPTSVAANDDMGVMVWVLGDERAIPTNYRGLELNDAYIDWMTGASNYAAVVSAAADEAGGQGFVTEFAQAMPEGLQARLDVTSNWEVSKSAADSRMDVVGAIETLTFSLGGLDGFVEAVRESVELSEDTTPSAFVGCPTCYTDKVRSGGSESDPILSTDLEAFLNAIEKNVIDPVRDTTKLFSNQRYLTRLYTTMSAGEMTKDPDFDFNPDALDVSNVHQAEMLIGCNDDWVVRIPDGRTVKGSGPQTWPYLPENGVELPFNSRVVQYKTSGIPEVIVDNSPQTFQPTEPLNPGMSPSDFTDTVTGSSRGSGGGCAVGPSGERTSNWWAVVGLGLLGLASLRNGARRRLLG